MKKKLLIATVCAVVWGSIGSTQAQVYPSRPITLVVPLPAGGAFDVTARVLAEHMRVSLGQSIIIENVTGAAGSIGTGRVARAAPDGYTLIFGGLNTHVVNPAFLALQYDVLKNFEPVALTASVQLLIVAKKAMPANRLNELIAWLKANPDKASEGTGGRGNTSHLAAILFQRETGARLALVPYRGAGAAINDLVAGHIDMMIDLAPNSLPHVRAGTIKAYAVTAKRRLAVAPEIPTVDEAGLPGFYMAVWQAIWAPKGTPVPVVAKLNAAVVDALADPAVRSRLSELGQEIYPREQQTPEALGAFHKAEIEKWWPLIKAANIKAE
jgi:tripartite-type tricarboxylate transporter receptor subunit TctC